MAQLQRFLWFVGGFDRSLLEQEACRTVRAKYSSIGGLVLMTAVLAVCSGGYAIYTVFDRLVTAVPMAALWGLFIFYLDRYLVGSNRKLATVRDYFTTLQTTPPYVEPHGWSSLGALAVRLLLAAAIGLVVAKPIEMVLLEPWILDQNRLNDDVDRARMRQASDLSSMDQEIARRERALEKLGDDVRTARRNLSGELDGTAGTGEVGEGPIAKKKDALLGKTEAEWQRDHDDLAAMKKRRDAEHDATEKTTVERRTARAVYRSVISDLASINEIEAHGGPKADMVRRVSFFLTWFFVIIEITPIFAKVVSGFDPYDASLLSREHPAILESLVRARQAHARVAAELGRS